MRCASWPLLPPEKCDKADRVWLRWCESAQIRWEKEGGRKNTGAFVDFDKDSRANSVIKGVCPFAHIGTNTINEPLEKLRIAPVLKPLTFSTLL